MRAIWLYRDGWLSIKLPSWQWLYDGIGGTFDYCWHIAVLRIILRVDSSFYDGRRVRLLYLPQHKLKWHENS